MFVTLEGPDGAGKTTQATLLVERLRAAGYSPVAVREPGGTALGNGVRALLLSRGEAPIHPWAEAMLFCACRAQLVHEVIRPALAAGAIVVADRFADSTLAYQGAGRSLPTPDLEALVHAATGGLCPDLTLLLDVAPTLGLARRRLGEQARPGDKVALPGRPDLPDSWNRFEDEGQAFHERVRSAYIAMAGREPARWVVVDATLSVEAVAEAIWKHVAGRLPAVAAAPG